jgi:signal transduction histidine kinase/ActR/RegA family two-component response regulator
LVLLAELVEASLDFRDMRTSITELQKEQAVAAADKISHYIDGIEKQLGWTVQLPWIQSTLDERQFDAFRLIRRTPEISELSEIDPSGREGLHVSPSKVDRVGEGVDYSSDPLLILAKRNGVGYGTAQFPTNAEPFMKIAVSGARPEAGFSIATINLTTVREIIAQIKLVNRGRAYVLDDHGRLISHLDSRLVLKRTSFADLPQVAQATADTSAAVGGATGHAPDGSGVLAGYAKIPHLRWIVFVESPEREAFAVIYDDSLRALGILGLAAILLAISGVALTRRLTNPIQSLRAGVARFGAGEMSRRIQLDTNDELEELAVEFNRMAEQLSDAYGGLERTVQERTLQLRLANEAKSRFLATATHDLRQPLHALRLFVSQLRQEGRSPADQHTVARIESALRELTELFDSLLDMSRLDAGVVRPERRSVRLEDILGRVERRFAHAAWEKGLHFRVVATTASIHTDPLLMERILMNLVSNAIKYTQSGGVLVGCRRRAESVNIEVLDSGPGIPERELKNVFKEFYQIENTENASGGLGIGLAIVEKLCSILGHVLEVRSKLDAGTCFIISAPISAEPDFGLELASRSGALSSKFHGHVMLFENDALALEATAAALKAMGFAVDAVGPNRDLDIADQKHSLDLIISDYHYSASRNGLEIIEAVRRSVKKKVPALIVTGDTRADIIERIRESGVSVLHKPLDTDELSVAIEALLNSGQQSRNNREMMTTASVLLEAPRTLSTPVT